MVGVVPTIRRTVHRVMNNYSYTGVQKRKTLANDMYTIARQLQQLSRTACEAQRIVCSFRKIHKESLQAILNFSWTF